jgi:PAS domain-containing protein
VIDTVAGRKPLRAVLRDRGISARDLLEALPAAVYLTDATGLLTFYNQAAADLWGRRPDLGSARWCGSWRLYRPDGTPLPHDRCPMAVAIRHNRQLRGVEALAERPDGARVPFAPHPTPLRDPDGELTGAVNLLVVTAAHRGGEAARRERPCARRVGGAGRRADDLLMAILPIAGMVGEGAVARRRPPSGLARALALRLMDENGLDAGPTAAEPAAGRN